MFERLITGRERAGLNDNTFSEGVGISLADANGLTHQGPTRQTLETRSDESNS
jgi:hypothetical protein